MPLDLSCPHRYGRTTEATEGSVEAINATVDVCYEARGPFMCVKVARFVDQIVITPGDFSAGGDSGSGIVTADGNNNPVGLLFAGSSSHTIANPIDAVLSAFNVTIDDGSAGGGGDLENHAPVASDDAYAATAGTTLEVAAPGVLGNDDDLDGDALTAVLDAGPSTGSLTLDPDGSFVYTPDASEDDSFTYHASDGTLDSNTVTVAITVSEPAGEIMVTGIQPETASAGSTVQVTVSGTGFAAGATVVFENGNGPAPDVSNVQWVDANTLTATVTVKDGGPPRERVWDVRVTNPDASTAVLAGGFTVTP